MGIYFRTIWEEAPHAKEADLKKFEGITPDEVAACDAVFIGSPLHSGSLAAAVKDCLGQLQAGSDQKMAGFITHSAPAYPDQGMDGFIEPMKAACKEKGIEDKGCFGCQGSFDRNLARSRTEEAQCIWRAVG